MAVQAYFEYPKFVKKMKEERRGGRALQIMRHPFFNKYYNKGFDLHPEQKVALANLGIFLAGIRNSLAKPGSAFRSEVLFACHVADKILIGPNEISEVSRKGLEDSLHDAARSVGLSCSCHFDTTIEKLEISASYKELLVALIAISNAKKDDVLMAGSMGNRVLFMLEVDNLGNISQDVKGITLIRLCAEALGGSLSATCGDSTSIFEMKLPVKAK